MDLIKIAPKDFVTKIHNLWDRQWMLLTAGDFEKGEYNTMTVAWGSLGVMWSKPFAQVVVRPTRHTYGFMNELDSFTLTAFPDRYKKALSLLGSKSGRDGDKIAEAGLTPVAASNVSAPAFAEAELVLECKTMYYHDLTAGTFVDESIHDNYPQKDYHRVYFGEIVAIRGVEAYNRECC